MTAPWRITAGNAPSTPPPHPWMAAFDAVVAEWENCQPTAHTSGSTGPPLTHRFHPDAVRASAHATAAHFGLNGNSIRTWSALPAAGTGGRMAVWRALILDWELTVNLPSSTPDVAIPSGPNSNRFDFGVATPMQAQHLMESGQLGRFQQLLLGGAPLGPALEDALLEAGRESACRIHVGFGMTETLTHIATRSLGSEAYRPLPGVTVHIGADQALIVDSPLRGVQQLHTRDAAQWMSANDTSAFRWLGRLDDVLNSGGIKVHPHSVERLLSPLVQGMLDARRWYVCGRTDETLGDRITLVLEGAPQEGLTETLLEACKDLGNIRPRSVEFLGVFEETASGKVLRR